MKSATFYSTNCYLKHSKYYKPVCDHTGGKKKCISLNIPVLKAVTFSSSNFCFFWSGAVASTLASSSLTWTFKYSSCSDKRYRNVLTFKTVSILNLLTITFALNILKKKRYLKSLRERQKQERAENTNN